MTKTIFKALLVCLVAFCGGNALAATLAFSGNPTSITAGGQTTLSWRSTRAESCTASGAWSGSKALTGQQIVSGIVTSSKYTLSCERPGRVAIKKTVTISVVPAPTVSLSANPISISSGASSTLSWSSTNATRCIASGAWSGSKAVSGSETVSNLLATSSYTLTCTGTGGSSTKSTTVNVSQVTPAPTVSLSASPSSVASGGSSSLVWSSANATACTATGAWTGARATTGAETISNLLATGTYTYTLACTGAGGTASKSAAVTVGVGDVVRPTPEQASRILSQATFGPNSEAISRLQTLGTSAWLNDQFAKKQTPHLAYMNSVAATLPAGKSLSQDHFLESFWQQAIKGDDQLRQRVAFALSQIFVISYQDSMLADMPRGVAQYYDVLGAYSFGNYRDLLEAVSLHPMMGNYLNSLRSQKTVGARVPDENYAREAMQLFTIGLRQLNQDGTETIPPAATYTNDDVQGLAKVFTGWSWAGSDKSNNRFFGNNTPTPDPNRDWLPMQNYPLFHETLDKVFLGATIPPNTSGEASLKIALDTLFNHPNVGPFIGHRLIQRLVTSNPSPAYVGRVAAAFANNGQGVRGDMKAVIKAVLQDTEATNPPTSNTAGKLREPVLRLANWMRAFNANSTSGRFLLTSLDNAQNSLGQTPMRSPSVFNFYRPDYQAPNTSIATAGKFAPEMQITEETSVVGYLNFMRDAIPNGTGTSRDIKANYTSALALAGTPALLVDYVNLLLMQNQMSSTLRGQILAAINSNPSNSASNKVYLAVFLTMASPGYLAQK